MDVMELQHCTNADHHNKWNMFILVDLSGFNGKVLHVFESRLMKFDNIIANVERDEKQYNIWTLYSFIRSVVQLKFSVKLIAWCLWFNTVNIK